MVRFVPEGDGFKLRREHPDETMHERFVPFRDGTELESAKILTLRMVGDDNRQIVLLNFERPHSSEFRRNETWEEL